MGELIESMGTSLIGAIFNKAEEKDTIAKQYGHLFNEADVLVCIMISYYNNGNKNLISKTIKEICENRCIWLKHIKNIRFSNNNLPRISKESIKLIERESFNLEKISQNVRGSTNKFIDNDYYNLLLDYISTRNSFCFDKKDNETTNLIADIYPSYIFPFSEFRDQSDELFEKCFYFEEKTSLTDSKIKIVKIEDEDKEKIKNFISILENDIKKIDKTAKKIFMGKNENQSFYKKAIKTSFFKSSKIKDTNSEERSVVETYPKILKILLMLHFFAQMNINNSLFSNLENLIKDIMNIDSSEVDEKVNTTKRCLIQSFLFVEFNKTGIDFWRARKHIVSVYLSNLIKVLKEKEVQKLLDYFFTDDNRYQIKPSNNSKHQKAMEISHEQNISVKKEIIKNLDINHLINARA